MSTDDDTLVRLLVAGDLPGLHHALAEAPPTTPVGLLVAALGSTSPADHLAHAARVARTTRDRQLVAITAAHEAGDHDRVAVLTRDHLVDHPDSLLAAYVASIATTSTTRTPQE